ncbi:MAG: putative broad substrate specificity phosphatase [Microbacteriaceae bacterium]|nr:putative broad substrate specificity phosphatase [Microbacteriaceae bacterium]
MTQLYLVRHGETNWNREHRIQGSTDIPLNDVGRAQAAATGRLLANRQCSGIVSSPLSRAMETAEIIGRELGINTVKPVAGIVERNYGEAEGLTDEGLARLFPGDTEVPGRESREEVAERVVSSLVALAQQHPGENIIVATHGGVIRSLLNRVAPGDRSHRGLQITNGSVHSFRLSDGQLELVAFDDPIDEREDAAGDDLDDQNAVEAREHTS